MAQKTFGPKDERAMIELQRAVSEVLLQANRRGVSRMVAAFALTRLIRELMNGVEGDARTAVIEQVIVPFLQGEPPEGEGGRVITLH